MEILVGAKPTPALPVLPSALHITTGTIGLASPKPKNASAARAGTTRTIGNWKDV